MKAHDQIFKAAVLGTEAFQRGVKCAPCLDKELMSMLSGRKIGETPEGEASSIKLMDAWLDSWHLANLAAA